MSEINNESQLYDIVNVVGVVSKISDDVLVEKDGLPLHFKKFKNIYDCVTILCQFKSFGFKY